MIVGSDAKHYFYKLELITQNTTSKLVCSYKKVYCADKLWLSMWTCNCEMLPNDFIPCLITSDINVLGNPDVNEL